jgi:glycosyltransferase involved in cell wall biosynthesis
MTGKAILSTRVGGVDLVLREEGLYVDGADLDESLRRALPGVARMERAELQRRGVAIRDRVLQEYNWDAQARRIIEFLKGIKTPILR